MGHTEMLLAVAGLDETVIARRNRRLASGDWAAFSPAEQVAFHFARNQARDPASVTEQDFRRLVRHFGRRRAVDVVWWTSHCAITGRGSPTPSRSRWSARTSSTGSAPRGGGGRGAYFAPRGPR
jgi:hypothetical protein